MAIGCPLAPGQAVSPAPWVETGTADQLVEMMVKYLMKMKQARHSVAPAYPRHTVRKMVFFKLFLS